MPFARTVAAVTRRPAPRGAVAVLAIAATVAALGGCGLAGESRLHFSTVLPDKLTEIQFGPGGSGDVVVRTANVTTTQLKRVVRYRGEQQPDATYRTEGSKLIANTVCGRMCSVSYEIEAPTGVTVRAELGSGDVTLTDVGGADVEVGSGSITLSGGTGRMVARSGSGDVTATDLRGEVTLSTGSGDISGERLGGAALTVKTGNGDVRLTLDRAGPVTGETGNGDVTVVVPKGSYQVRTTTRSGDERVGVPHDPAGKHVLRFDTGNGDISLNAR